MKLSIIYYSKDGHTKEMAQVISEGMKRVEGIEVGMFDLNNIDKAFIDESKAVVFGTPTYSANLCWQMKKWLDESKEYNLEGKLGSAYATAGFSQGGPATAIATILNHLMVKGMLVYSGGSALGKPYTHTGAVAITDRFEESKDMFRIFGERIAKKAKEIF